MITAPIRDETAYTRRKRGISTAKAKKACWRLQRSRGQTPQEEVELFVYRLSSWCIVYSTSCRSGSLPFFPPPSTFLSVLKSGRVWSRGDSVMILRAWVWLWVFFSFWWFAVRFVSNGFEVASFKALLLVILCVVIISIHYRLLLSSSSSSSPYYQGYVFCIIISTLIFYLLLLSFLVRVYVKCFPHYSPSHCLSKELKVAWKVESANS